MEVIVPSGVKGLPDDAVIAIYVTADGDAAAQDPRLGSVSGGVLTQSGDELAQFVQQASWLRLILRFGRDRCALCPVSEGGQRLPFSMVTVPMNSTGWPLRVAMTTPAAA